MNHSYKREHLIATIALITLHFPNNKIKFKSFSRSKFSDLSTSRVSSRSIELRHLVSHSLYVCARHDCSLSPCTADISAEHSLGEFVRDRVIRYVEDDNSEIRRAASLSSCAVLASDPVVSQTSNNAIRLVNEVLEKLLTLAIADPGILRLFSSLTFSHSLTLYLMN